MSAKWIVADHDEAAVDAAKDMMDGAPRYELWERSRLVIRLDNGRKP